MSEDLEDVVEHEIDRLERSREEPVSDDDFYYLLGAVGHKMSDEYSESEIILEIREQL